MMKPFDVILRAASAIAGQMQLNEGTIFHSNVLNMMHHDRTKEDNFKSFDREFMLDMARSMPDQEDSKTQSLVRLIGHMPVSHTSIVYNYAAHLEDDARDDMKDNDGLDNITGSLFTLSAAYYGARYIRAWCLKDASMEQRMINALDSFVENIIERRACDAAFDNEKVARAVAARLFEIYNSMRVA